MVAVALLSIFLTAAARQWSFIQRRELEKELIHRGERIQLALLWWRSGGQPLPNKLEDMTKGPRRVLSSVPWDPMTARFDHEGKLQESSGSWTLIREGDLPPQPGAQTQRDEVEERRGGERQSRMQVQAGAGGIRGVHSSSELESIGAWEDVPAGSPYTEWRFELMAGVTATAAPQGRLPDIDYPPGFPGLRKPGGPPVPHGNAPGRPASGVPGGAPR